MVAAGVKNLPHSHWPFISCCVLISHRQRTERSDKVALVCAVAPLSRSCLRPDNSAPLHNLSPAIIIVSLPLPCYFITLSRRQTACRLFMAAGASVSRILTLCCSNLDCSSNRKGKKKQKKNTLPNKSRSPGCPQS